MADISTITLPDGTTYNIKDPVARSQGGALYYVSQAVSVASNSEIFRITNSAITTDTVVIECTFANPNAISSNVTWTSYDGYISFVGTCTSATTANVTLMTKVN